MYYFTNEEALIQLGRRLNPSYTLQGLRDQLRPGEVLIGEYYNGAYVSRPLLDSEEVFAYHEQDAVSSTYYAVYSLLASSYLK
jgi:hypothetical protein